MNSRQLFSETVSVAGLCGGVMQQLYRLYEQCYDGSDRARFEADLGEKKWMILLRDARSSAIVGFSTQMLMDIEVEGTPVRALFSGDTVIHPDYWGSQELVRAWCRLAGSVKAQSMSHPLYWFLVSKGHRTYLYLPYFFERFYPRYDRVMPPFVKRLIRILGAAKYPREFNPESGLVEHPADHDRLKSDLDGTARHLNNPHVRFFTRMNPNYKNGSELLCVAEISPENMRSIAKRELETGLYGVEPRVAVR
jgi:hypothetical protein